MDKGYTIPVLDHGYVRYIDHMGTDERIVEAARISYKSPSKGPEADKKLLRYLWKNMHSSPFEQVNITFNIKLPLFVQAQMVRHRTQRLNQMSARYTEMLDEFYIPSEWRLQDTKNKQGSVSSEELDHKQLTVSCASACQIAYNAYKDMLNVGVAREMARMLLPQNLYTEIYTNWDLKNLCHFLNLRLDSHAQFEIQEYARAIHKIAKELFPWTIECFDVYKPRIVNIQVL